MRRERTTHPNTSHVTDDPYGHNHTGTHRVDDCLHRDMTEYGEWMNHQKGNE